MRSLFLSPQSGVGPPISSSVVLFSVFLLVCISVPVLAVYFCPSSVRVVATFSGTVLFPLLSYLAIWTKPVVKSLHVAACLMRLILYLAGCRYLAS